MPASGMSTPWFRNGFMSASVSTITMVPPGMLDTGLTRVKSLGSTLP